MTIELLKPIKSNGEIIPEGTLVRIDSHEVTERMIKEGVGRVVNLADTLDGILRQAILAIDAGRIWNTTAQVRKLETVIDNSYRDVLAGSKTVEEFKAEVTKWRQAGTQEPEANNADGWGEAMAGLIQWFANASLPEDSFSICDHEHILNPEKYYSTLRRDIDQGPSGPRARTGALRGDLQRLKAFCEGMRKARERGIIARCSQWQKNKPEVLSCFVE